jgi:hypothetical protein
MRIWDLPPHILCRKHLLGEHRELHAIWSIITRNKKGYSKHPETLRWVGKLQALYLRHESLVEEMNKRGYKHKSILDESIANGSAVQTSFLESQESQIKWLKSKKCHCLLEAEGAPKNQLVMVGEY